MRNATPAQMLLGLRIHAVVYALTIIILLVINFLIGPPYWFGWVVLGWGVGLVAHWLSVRYHSAHKTELS